MIRNWQKIPARGGPSCASHHARTPPPARSLTVDLVRSGEQLRTGDLAGARDLLARGLESLPWEGLALSHGEPASPTRQVSAR